MTDGCVKREGLPMCAQCGLNWVVYEGARFCGGACSQEYEMGISPEQSRRNWEKHLRRLNRG